MLRFLSPGDLASDLLGLTNGEHRIIFRMFVNTLVLGAVATLVMIAFLA